MFLGASSWVFSWAPPYADAIRAISRLGFQGVELTVWNNEFMEDYYTQSTNTQLRKLIDDQGLVLTNLFCLPSNGASSDKKLRDKGVEELKRAADIAKQLGTSQLTTCSSCPFEIDFPFEQNRPVSQTWTVNLPKGLDWKQNYDDFLDTMRRYAQVCEENDVYLALEPHPHRYMKNADSMLRILSQLDTDRIGMNFDPSHLFPMGEIPQVTVYQVGGAIMHCHFSDNDGQSNAHWRPGKGKIDWNATVSALNDIGYSGAISLELEDVPGAAGYPGFNRDPSSVAETIEREYALAKRYMEDIFHQEGLNLGR